MVGQIGHRYRLSHQVVERMLDTEGLWARDESLASDVLWSPPRGTVNLLIDFDGRLDRPDCATVVKVFPFALACCCRGAKSGTPAVNLRSLRRLGNCRRDPVSKWIPMEEVRSSQGLRRRFLT